MCEAVSADIKVRSTLVECKSIASCGSGLCAFSQDQIGYNFRIILSAEDFEAFNHVTSGSAVLQRNLLKQFDDLLKYFVSSE